jgi:hypothetical protein
MLFALQTVADNFKQIDPRILSRVAKQHVDRPQDTLPDGLRELN